MNIFNIRIKNFKRFMPEKMNIKRGKATKPETPTLTTYSENLSIFILPFNKLIHLIESVEDDIHFSYSHTDQFD